MSFARLVALSLTACAAMAVAAAPAGASKDQSALFQDDALLLGRDLATQQVTLDEIEAFGVDQIHAIVYWRTYLADPEGDDRPDGDRTDSGDSDVYDQGRWDLLDNLVREADDRGIRLLLTPAATSTDDSIGLPEWARERDDSPDTSEAYRFFRAVLERYNGEHEDESGDGKGDELPKVKDWSFWNEPNQGGWIEPQFEKVKGETIPYSPIVYRELFERGQRAMRKEDHDKSRVFLAETAPLGDPKGREKSTSAMPPGQFLREAACLDEDYDRYRGRDRSRRDCKGFDGFDDIRGLNHHFYTKGEGQPPTFRPDRKGFEADWYPIGVANRFRSFVDKVARNGGWKKNLQIYNTEFGYQSNPPDRKSGVDEDEQGQFINESEYLQYKQKRIRSYAQYLMNDDPCDDTQVDSPEQLVESSKCLGFQTGIRLTTGKNKDAFDAYRMPIVVRRSRKDDTVKVWGAALRRKGGVETELLRDGEVIDTFEPGSKRGYFDMEVEGDRKDEFQIRDVETGTTSREAKASSKRIK